MILLGDPVKGEYASSCGLVDALFENDQIFARMFWILPAVSAMKSDPKRSCADMTVIHPDPKGYLAGFRDKIAHKSQKPCCP